MKAMKLVVGYLSHNAFVQSFSAVQQFASPSTPWKNGVQVCRSCLRDPCIAALAAVQEFGSGLEPGKVGGGVSFPRVELDAFHTGLDWFFCHRGGSHVCL
jgi:hypothetical protein